MQRKHNGFTLVELAIVLVVIGLILGMVFKGRDLIDGAKVKNASAQVTKVQAAINTYFERYNTVVGDGCGTFVTTGNVCTGGTTNGMLNANAEAGSAINLLINSGMLQQADLRSPWGNNWFITTTAANAAQRRDANVAYVMVGNNQTPAPLAALPGAGNVDIRHVCALDRAIDDGNPTTGTVRSSATAGPSGATSYDATTDCYASTQTGQVTLAVRVLP